MKKIERPRCLTVYVSDHLIPFRRYCTASAEVYLYAHVRTYAFALPRKFRGARREALFASSYERWKSARFPCHVCGRSSAREPANRSTFLLALFIYLILWRRADANSHSPSHSLYLSLSLRLAPTLLQRQVSRTWGCEVFMMHCPRLT